MNTNPSYHNYLLCQNDLCGKWHHANLRWFDNKCGLGTHWANAMTVYLIDSLWLILSGTSFQLLSPTSWQCRGMVKGRFKISLVLCTWLGHKHMSVWWLFPVFLIALMNHSTGSQKVRKPNRAPFNHFHSYSSGGTLIDFCTDRDANLLSNFFLQQKKDALKCKICALKEVGKKVSLPPKDHVRERSCTPNKQDFDN